VLLLGGLVVCGTASEASSAQHIPGHPPASTASLQGTVRDDQGRGIPGVRLTLVQPGGRAMPSSLSDGEGIFRLRDLQPGGYQLKLDKEGYQPLSFPNVQLRRGELLSLDLKLLPISAGAPASKGPSGLPGATHTTGGVPESAPASTYPGLRGPRPQGPPGPLAIAPEQVPQDSANFSPDPDRWDATMPQWNRYGKPGEFPYTKSHWYDPFNRSKLKGDEPVFGQRWFFNFTGTSLTSIDARRLPVPSGVAAENPGGSDFFGKGGQGFVSENLRFSFDLFHGDASFRPVDFRIRFTPEVNLNYLQTRERGLVNIDVREGIARFDQHTGIQEAFVEAKLHDLSPNFDFVSLRAGIQQFTSDFRGFLFSEEQPGIRLFGNLRSNRINYNLAYFYFLEKDTNSGLNTFNQRHQQVYIGNVYIQDFLAKGYTTEFSFHYNCDDPSIHFDENDFLVRPAPVGAVVNDGIITHGIRAYYLGWTSNGHIGRLNVSHAFYQALGHDTFNPIAGRRVDINARMAALELSVDKDWARFRTSFFYASGDDSKTSGVFRTDGTAHGFDTIVDNTHFAGGAFSFWDNEAIRLTGSGVLLVGPGSLLPSLRSNKEEGQANFVNPGIYLANVGADFDVTPKIRAFVNGNYLRFDRTEPLEQILFQAPIRHSIGTDLGVGLEYRPPLTENIVITGGASTLIPGGGFQDIYNPRVLFSVFSTVRLVF
jgi:hypothetical protein